MKETKFKQTEIGMIPEEWDIKKIKDLFDIFVGGDAKKLTISKTKTAKFKYPIYSNSLRDKGLYGFSDNFQYPSDCITITSRGEVGIAEYRGKPFNAIVRLIVLKPKTDVSSYFMTNFINSKLDFQIVGSAVNQLTAPMISDFLVAFPPPPEQRAIAKILSDLDSKIELLQRQNETLEKIGQVIFQHWFVDFEFPNEEGKPYKSSGGEMVYNEELGKEIPRGWKIGKLANLVDNIKRSLKPGQDLIGRKYVPIDEIPMKKLGLYSSKPIEEAKSSLISFEKGDILFGAMRAYFHRVNFAYFKGVTRTTTMVLRPKKETYFSYALLLLNLPESVEYANTRSKGSTMPYAVWENSLEDLPCVIHNDTINLFDNMVKPMLEKISFNAEQIQTLQKTRDFLLPELMTGKLRVPVEVFKNDA